MQLILQVREDFPVFAYQDKHGKRTHPLTYLDSAATTHKPKVVVDALSEFYLHEYGTVHRAIYDLSAKATDRYEAVRVQLKEFIKAKTAQEIVFTRGATEAINLVAYSFGRTFLQEGDEILISQAEHHANMIPWQILAQEKKVHLKVIPILDSGDLDMQAFYRLLSNKTKLVSIAYMTNTTGAIYPITEVVAAAHQVGARVLVDAAQAVGHIRLDVQALDVDFLVCSAHKMYGPTGVGLLYGKQELLKIMPPFHGGGDMVDKVTFEGATYQEPPLRFEAGTPMIAEVIGWGVAIDYLQNIGLEKIAAHEHSLTREAIQLLKMIPGIKILGDTQKRGPIITFLLEQLHPLDVGALLNLKGVAIRTGSLCAQPLLQRFGVQTAMRISFGMYNDMKDVHRFVQALQEVILLLKEEMTY